MIKNIIFDLGGVIYDIRYENIADAFAKMGAGNLVSLYSKSKQTDFIDLFEEGRISVSDFCGQIRLLSSVPLTNQQIADAWNADGAPGIVYTTDWDGKPVVHDRMHWTLAEAINASAVLYRVTKEEE